MNTQLKIGLWLQGLQWSAILIIALVYLFCNWDISYDTMGIIIGCGLLVTYNIFSLIMLAFGVANNKK